MDVYALPSEVDLSVYVHNLIFYESGEETYYVVFGTLPMTYKKVGTRHFAVASDAHNGYVYKTDFTNWEIFKSGNMTKSYIVNDVVGEATDIQTDVTFNLILEATPTPEPSTEATPTPEEYDLYVKSLQDYDASVYTYNALIYEENYNVYYLFVSTKDIVNYSTFNGDKAGWDIIFGHWAEEFDYILYQSSDNYIYQKIDAGHAQKVNIGFTTGDVNYELNKKIGVEEEYVETPEINNPSNVVVNVTVGDELTEAIAEIQQTNISMVEAQQITNGLLCTVLFFFIFVWAEKRIKHAVRSFTGRGLDE